MKSNKKRVKRNTRFNFALSEKDVAKLNLFAAERGLGRTMALRQIVRERLRDYTPASPSAEVHNQIGLFDSVQVDIFNNTTVLKSTRPNEP